MATFRYLRHINIILLQRSYFLTVRFVNKFKRLGIFRQIHIYRYLVVRIYPNTAFLDFLFWTIKFKLLKSKYIVYEEQ